MNNVFLCAGEYIKNWRARWFVLRSDGTFQGFKQRPAGAGAEPLNNFKIEREPMATALVMSFLSLLTQYSIPCAANVNILANDKLKKNAFVIR